MGSGNFNSTLITPIHALGPTHTTSGIGSTVTWGSETKTILSLTNHPTADVSVATLDSAVVSAAPATLLDEAAFDYFWNLGEFVPLVWARRNTGDACIITVEQFPTRNSGVFNLNAGLNIPAPDYRAARVAWSESPTNGDSGSPAFLIINSILALASLVSFATFGGPFLPTVFSWIRSVVQSVGRDLRAVNLQSFLVFNA